MRTAPPLGIAAPHSATILMKAWRSSSSSALTVVKSGQLEDEAYAVVLALRFQEARRRSGASR